MHSRQAKRGTTTTAQPDTTDPGTTGPAGPAPTPCPPRPTASDGAAHRPSYGVPAQTRAGGPTPVPVPRLRHRRDGILPTVAAALTVQGDTLTGTAARGDRPPALHPLVQDFLDALPHHQRDRCTGRCAETLVISRRIQTAEAARGKRGRRRPISRGEARRALRHATLTTRRIREDGDPLHGSFAGPCGACAALADHFGVRIVNTAGTPDR